MLFEHYVDTQTVQLKYARGKPAVSGREFHDFHEIVLFLGGKSELISKNIQQQLVPGTIVMIPKGQFHQFKVQKPESYTRCILDFHETVENAECINRAMSEVKIIVNPDSSIKSLFDSIMRVAEEDFSESEKQLFVDASLTQLMILLTRYNDGIIVKNSNLSYEVSKALGIIDERFAEKLSVDTIAKELHISRSTLSHKFSKELGISLYGYITKKRLSVVHESVKNGVPITDAALNNGFSDYSCFYRLYKKYYK